MATWKKVIVSGSDASLTKIGLGTANPSTLSSGEISASGKIFAATAQSTGVAGPYNVVIQGDNGELMFTSSANISPSIEALNIGTGIMDTGGASSYDGSAEVTLAFDSSSAAGLGLEASTTAGKIKVKSQAGGHISVAATGISFDSGSAVDADKGLDATTVAGKISAKVDGTTIGFDNGALTASFQNAADLSGGTGIDILNGGSVITYNGSVAGTVKVDTADIAGGGLAAAGANSDTTLELKNNGALTDYTLLLWDNDNKQVANSAISQNAAGTTVTIGGASTTTTVEGNLTVAGNASFLDTQDFKVKDPFVLFNSGSGADNAFGIIGEQASNTDGRGWVYAGGATGRWEFTTDVDTTGAGDAGTAQGAAVLYVGTDNTTTDANKAQAGNIVVNGSGDIYMYA